MLDAFQHSRHHVRLLHFYFRGRLGDTIPRRFPHLRNATDSPLSSALDAVKRRILARAKMTEMLYVAYWYLISLVKPNTLNTRLRKLRKLHSSTI